MARIAMNPEQPMDNESSASPEQLWKEMREEVDTIADRLGLPIDEQIKEPVIAFKVHGFTTSASCEGHPTTENETADEAHGLPFPWIEIYAPEPAGWEESEEKQAEWRRDNLQQQRKMMLLLADCYQERETPFEARLTFQPVGAFGGFRVQSFGAEVMFLLSKEEQRQTCLLYRRELNDFTRFLHDRSFLPG